MYFIVLIHTYITYTNRVYCKYRGGGTQGKHAQDAIGTQCKQKRFACVMRGADSVCCHGDGAVGGRGRRAKKKEQNVGM